MQQYARLKAFPYNAILRNAIIAANIADNDCGIRKHHAH